MSKFALLYYWRAEPLDDTWWRVESFADLEHPNSITFEGGPRPTRAQAFSWTTLDADGRLVVGMTHDHMPDAPDLWWVLVDEPHPWAPTVSLVAFADGTFPDGTVLTSAQLRASGVKPGAQAGAIRWGKGDPKLEQVYTAPEHRRKRMSVKMVHTADIVNEAAGWGGYLYGGAELTPDGVKLAEAWNGSQRLKPLTIQMPPMGG
jgi:hypothetical protein